MAQRLVDEGHTVRSLPERSGHGPSADLNVCGEPVEIKSWRSLEERGNHRPTARSVLNKLLKAREQAPTVVLNAHGSQLLPSTVRSGLQMYGSRDDGGRLHSVRVLGDGFDLSFTRRRDLAVSPPEMHRPKRAQREGGLGLG